jgi:VanZ family protein
MIITTITIAVIVYGSLYPFDFSVPGHGEGPVFTLFKSWEARPGRGDFISNTLLYVLFGLFGVLSFQRQTSFWLRLPIIIIGGTLLSIAMELSQYFDAGRVTSASDIYANVIGAILGSLGAIALSEKWRVPLFDEISETPIPAFLMVVWVSYRLYPYVPTIDLHKYWGALRPTILDPTITFYDLYRHTAIWLTLFGLIERIVGQRRAGIFAPLFAGCILVARILIMAQCSALPKLPEPLSPPVFGRSYLPLTNAGVSRFLFCSLAPTLF